MPLSRPRTWLVSVVLLAALLPSSADAWFPFIASNGQPTKWVWNSSCNAGSRPITVLYDAAMNPALPSSSWMTGIVQSVHDSWNSGLTPNLLQAPSFSASNSTATSVNSYMRSPPPNTIRVVWDSTGAIFSSLGITSTGILGIGLGFNTNSARPQDICSGLVLLNGAYIQTRSPKDGYLYFTLQHELGHVFGLAHSIAGDNTSVGVFSTSTVPTMYPFAPLSPAAVGTPLRADDEAAKKVLYGP